MSDYRQHSIPLDILDDLAARFIINIPEEERKDLIRICFQIQLAHWFYLDEYVNGTTPHNHGFKPCSIREFAAHMFSHIKFLKRHQDRLDLILDEWREYKSRVPTYGAILLNQDLSKVILVQGFWSKSSWGFPKGKVNEDEPGHVCAVREVLEETGYDIEPIIDPQDYLENVVADQLIRLYLIPGVAEETVFKPKTRCEIRDIRWFPVDSLPSAKKDSLCETTLTMGANKFYMVIPFVKGLRKWVLRRARHRLPTQKDDGRKGQTEARTPPRLPASFPSASSVMDDFCPKAWKNVRLHRKDILTALETTPGWIN